MSKNAGRPDREEREIVEEGLEESLAKILSRLERLAKVAEVKATEIKGKRSENGELDAT